MPRYEHDEWDIASSVGVTALGVASGRAIESKRANALISDPYADTLVTAADTELPMPTQLPHPGYEDHEEFHQLWSHTATHMGLRTRFFDEFFRSAGEAGITQAVLLASGLDARAWRLDWPQETVLFEIDQPRVLAFKDDVLATRHAEPRCARRTVPCDLRDEWPSALDQAGFDPTQPTAWLAEGLLPYLPAEAEARLLATVHELSAPGSRLALEHARALHALIEANKDWFQQLAEQFGVNLPDLFYDNDTRPDPDKRLADRGWRTSRTTGDKLAASYGRSLESGPLQLAGQQRYITAHLPT